jgi:GntR family transcriptional regulator
MDGFMTRIERNPVYQQLNDLLRTALAERYSRGDRFLTEREISERYQVSRATANKALASLVSEGLIEFRRGIGTFVRRDVIEYDVRSLVSFTEKARLAGKRPSTELLTFGTISATRCPAAVVEALGIGAGADVGLWEIERVRLADGVPVIFEHRFVVHALCPKLTRVQAAGSLYQAWTKHHSLQISGADSVIRAVVAGKTVAGHLMIPARSPALEVTGVGYVHGQLPLWWERTMYRSDQYEFHTRLGPIRSSTPARGQLRSDTGGQSKVN